MQVLKWVVVCTEIPETTYIEAKMVNGFQCTKSETVLSSYCGAACSVVPSNAVPWESDMVIWYLKFPSHALN